MGLGPRISLFLLKTVSSTTVKGVSQNAPPGFVEEVQGFPLQLILLPSVREMQAHTRYDPIEGKY